MKKTHWTPALLPKHDEAKLRKAGYVKDPTLGWTNTRDPWWLTAWVYLFWVALCLIMSVGLFWTFNLPK